jgi:nitrate reductase NapAB chaperone NapD
VVGESFEDDSVLLLGALLLLPGLMEVDKVDGMTGWLVVVVAGERSELRGDEEEREALEDGTTA